ncbi:tetratricopeptide repeat protein [Bacteroidota bacterium]
MSRLEITKNYQEYCDLIYDRKVKESFDLIYKIISSNNLEHYKFTIDNYYETYKNILKYSFELVEDPEKEKIYNRLLKSLLELADEIYETVIVTNNYLSYYNIKNDIFSITQESESEKGNIFQKLLLEKEFENIIDEDKQLHTEKSEKRIKNIFRIIWFSNKISENEYKLILELKNSNTISWYDKCLVVSALTLSLQRYFDINKIKLLFEFYSTSIDQLWQRALIGIFLSLIQYNERINLYPDIVFRLQELSDNNDFKAFIEDITIQYIQSKDTEKISKKLREEIIPEMIKYKSKLEDKLDLDKIISEKQLEEKNPEWETFFKDSPGLYDKLEEFSKLQLEGADVFISAFAMLKHFNFFKEIQNWFAPFYKENNKVINSVKKLSDSINENEFIEGIEQSTFLCNSDKYSFCLNIEYLPTAQKEMIANLFSMELKAMNELEQNDGLINNRAKNKAIFKQYLQDLYRFYKLHPLKHEFIDIFAIDTKLKDTIILNKIIDKSLLRNIGEYYFEKDDYENAIEIFLELINKDDNFEILEKTGYCYQQLNNYEKALKYYLKAELFDKNKLWLLKKIAFCYRMLNEFKKANEYLLEAERNEPENLYIQSNLGRNFMEMEDFETALKYFYKVEYLAPDNRKIQRPIAWCSFLLGKFEAAQKYFKKVLKSESNKHDYLNLGHVEWCIGNKNEAIKNYKSALKNSEYDFNWFTTEYLNDSKHLIKNGIESLDIPLMLDFIKMSMDN